MASTYTSRIRLEQQGDGENANTWGQRLNQNVIDLVDEAVAGYESIDVSAAASVTLTANNGTTDQARNFGLKFTGTLIADTTVVVPAQEKVYFVHNSTSGDFDLFIKPAGGTPVTAVGSGKSMIIAGDGISFNKFTDGSFDAGTRMLFQQDTAPVGWTAVSSSDYDDVGLRIVAPDTYTTAVGGSVAFSTVFASAITVSVVGATGNSGALTVTGSVAGHTLTVAQIPAHTHGVTNYAGVDQNNYRINAGVISGESGSLSGSTGGGGSHSHGAGTLSAASHNHTVSAAGTVNFEVKYVNFIIAQKD